ncbi:hypothetical protein [Gordonia sp. 'Campus']|uniref:hypothetical protein n=1 Tax=Gordonia sp. 'Campus' TaxID=2915824 RepID=UPI001EE4CE9A|nr:hypothetical protein [Gordonia sp. 'Campus']
MSKPQVVSWFMIGIAVAIVAVGGFSSREMSDRFLVVALVAAVVSALQVRASRDDKVKPGM